MQIYVILDLKQAINYNLLYINARKPLRDFVMLFNKYFELITVKLYFAFC